MKFDTTKKGLLSAFKPYQVEILKFLMEKKESAVSGEVWLHLNKHEDTDMHMSRASAIFFLNDMVDEGIVSFCEKSGKGGYHRCYTIIYKTEAELMKFLVEDLEAFIKDELTPKISTNSII